jgi:hypothetical protein
MDTALATAVAAAVFAAYLPTVQLGVPGGDSGELLAEACSLGVAHPPGYPLFVLLGRAAMDGLALLGVGGTPAYRVNLASTGLGAVTAGLLYLVAVPVLAAVAPRVPHVARRFLAAAVCSWCFALSPLVWMYAVGAEVFALNNFFVAAILLVFVRYAGATRGAVAEGASPSSPSSSSSAPVTSAPPPTRGWTCLLAFVCGLSLCNQHTSILLIIPAALWVLWSQRRTLSAVDLACYSAAAVLGLLPYAHLPLAHTYWRNPGSWGDATTLGGFLHHFLRSDYGTLRLFARADASAEGFSARNGAYTRDLVREQMPRGLALFVFIGIGIAASHATLACCGIRWRAGKAAKAAGTAAADVKAAPPSPSTASSSSSSSLDLAAVSASFPAALPLFYLFYFAVFHSLSNMPLSDPLLAAIHARFWLQPNALAFLLAACGLAGTAHHILGLFETWTERGRGTKGAKDAGARGPRPASAAPGPVSAAPVAPPAPTPTRLIAAVAVGVAALGAAVTQHVRNRPRLAFLATDDVLDRYSRALLLPLPPKAVLVTSYDFQWTGARYLQACEGVRTDVALLNGPVMSYAWFEAQQSLYPSVRFPGTHLVPHMTRPHADGGFSLADFFVANTAEDCGEAYARSYGDDTPTADAAWVVEGRGPKASQAPCAHRHGGLFHTGSLLFAKDTAHTHQFDWVPHGLASRVVLRWRDAAEGGLRTWRNVTEQPESGVEAHAGGDGEVPLLLDDGEVEAARGAWEAATRLYDGRAPELVQYDESMWEFATRADFFAQAVVHSTWLLEWALSPEAQGPRAIDEERRTGVPAPRDAESVFDLPSILEAASLLEESLAAQLQYSSASVLPSVYKNLGLAYVRLVRSQRRFPEGVALPRLPNTSGEPATDEAGWRAQAAERVLQTWGHYLTLREAREDAGYATISQVVHVLRDARDKAARAQEAGAGRRAGRTGAATTSGARQAQAQQQQQKQPLSGRGRVGERSPPREEEEEDEGVEVEAEDVGLNAFMARQKSGGAQRQHEAAASGRYSNRRGRAAEEDEEDGEGEDEWGNDL